MNDHNDIPSFGDDFHERLQELLPKCTEREALILRIRLGLDDGKPKTLEETADLFGISCERVRQIECKAIRRHSHAKRVKTIKDFYH